MKARTTLLLAFCALCLRPWPTVAQWTSETHQLQAGWNGIYALNDCSHATFDELLAPYPEITSVWRWEPTNLSARFLGDPTRSIRGHEWKNWVRGEPENSNMSSMLPNFGYLIYVDEASTGPEGINVSFLGKAVVTKLEWRSSGSNLLGFPSQSSLQPTFGGSTVGFLSPLLEVGYNPSATRIEQYIGGPLNDLNPERVANLAQASITRGRAYWIKLPIHSNYVSPIQLTLSDLDGLHYGSLGTSKNLRLTNLGGTTSTVVVTPTSSLAPPIGQDPITGEVPLLVRAWNAEAQRFEYNPLVGPLTASLEPGASVEWTLIPNRQAMLGPVGASFASVLRITDNVHLVDLTVPVTAEVTGLSGLWIGSVAVTNVVNQINRFERDAEGNTLYDENGQPTPLPPDSAESATAQSFPLRLIMHVNEQGDARLLSNVYHGLLDTETVGFSVRQNRLHPQGLEDAVRITAVHLPLDVNAALTPSTLATGGSYSVAINLDHNDPTNPFVHTYHPDHDNLGPRFDANAPLPSSVESFTVNRSIALDFDDSSPNNDPTWGNRTLTGDYAETIDGLHKQSLEVSGRFELRRVSQTASSLAE